MGTKAEKNRKKVKPLSRAERFKKTFKDDIKMVSDSSTKMSERDRMACKISVKAKAPRTKKEKDAEAKRVHKKVLKQRYG